ncbi:MAG: hypothetical protein LAO30_23910 [Acidobacteriia bacterium]|nr:hypothetical protein [Terriglobia bacterium]
MPAKSLLEQPFHGNRTAITVNHLGCFGCQKMCLDRNVIFDTRQLQTPLHYPMTMYKDPEAPHAVENLSKTITLHLVRVEMKK